MKKELDMLICPQIHTNRFASLHKNQKVPVQHAWVLWIWLDQAIQFAEVCCCMRQHFAVKQMLFPVKRSSSILSTYILSVS